MRPLIPITGTCFLGEHCLSYVRESRIVSISTLVMLLARKLWSSACILTTSICNICSGQPTKRHFVTPLKMHMIIIYISEQRLYCSIPEYAWCASVGARRARYTKSQCMPAISQRHNHLLQRYHHGIKGPVTQFRK